MSTPSRARTNVPAGTLVLMSALIAVGSVLGLLEAAFLPPLPGGVRLGLANVAVLVALRLLGPRRALAVGAGRVAVVAVLAGRLGPAVLLASAGLLAAWVAMTAASRHPGLSEVGWSVAGSAAHVIGQLAVAGFLVGSAVTLRLVPISLALSLPAGLATGSLARIVVSRVPRTVLLTAR